MSGNVFFAVPLSESERHALAAVLSDQNVAKTMPGKRTRPDNWHITLRFIGEADGLSVDRLTNRVSELLGDSHVAPTRLVLEGIDGFPTPSRAAVAFVGVRDPHGSLAHLAAIADEAAVDVGFEHESRPFVPHLTLARIRPPRDIGPLRESVRIEVPMHVRTVTLYRSEITRSGPAFDVLDSFPLAE